MMLNKQINFSDYDDKENVKNENGINQNEIFNQICSQDTPFTEQLEIKTDNRSMATNVPSKTKDKEYQLKVVHDSEGKIIKSSSLLKNDIHSKFNCDELKTPISAIESSDTKFCSENKRDQDKKPKIEANPNTVIPSVISPPPLSFPLPLCHFLPF